MKRFGFRLAILVLICLVFCMAFAQPAIDPIGPIDPVEKKPALVKSQYEFEHTGRFYHKVKMPDGSTQEIKSLVPLTPKQWEERAAKAYVKPIEPDPACEECHNGCGRQQ